MKIMLKLWGIVRKNIHPTLADFAGNSPICGFAYFLGICIIVCFNVLLRLIGDNLLKKLGQITT